MDKLLLGLSLLCLTWTVSGGMCENCKKNNLLKAAPKALKCKSCKYAFINSPCPFGAGICTAKANETCSTRKFIFGGRILYATLKCKKNCESKKIQKGQVTWDYECCSGRNYCNGL